LYRHEDWYEFSNIPEVCAASIIRAIITLMMEAAQIFEKLVNSFQSTQCYNPEEAVFLLYSLTQFLFTFIHLAFPFLPM
jgi:hypothetical protein